MVLSFAASQSTLSVPETWNSDTLVAPEPLDASASFSVGRINILGIGFNEDDDEDAAKVEDAQGGCYLAACFRRVL